MFIYMSFMILILMMVVYLLFYFISFKMVYNMETSSGYECGFNFISNNRMTFSYRFFLIGILFLIFDLEIVILLSIPYMMLNMMNIMVCMIFILVLILGLLYEYYCGSLEWMNYSYF